jgi:hypothetical protein
MAWGGFLLRKGVAKYNQFTVQYRKFEGTNMADANGFKDAPMECLESRAVGLWAENCWSATSVPKPMI